MRSLLPAVALTGLGLATGVALAAGPLGRAAQRSAAPPTAAYGAPAGKRVAKVVPGGETILPNGRLLTPAGSRLWAGENLWSVERSPDGRILAGFFEGGIALWPADRSRPRLLQRRDFAFTGRFT
ncbi:MAG: hypothetical protein ACKO5K_08050, partial [Armatimonadota bacterium]